MGAVPQPDALPPVWVSNRMTRQPMKSWSAGGETFPKTTVWLQQETFCSPRWFCISTRIHGNPKRLRNHLPLAPVGRSSASRLVSADDRCDFDGVNGYQPVTTDPNYVAPASRTNRWAHVGIPPICCPDISTGRVPLPRPRWVTPSPTRSAPWLHPVVELHRRAQTSGGIW